MERPGSWEVERDGDSVIARFGGYLSAENGREAVEAFVAAIGDDHVVAVFDLRQMEGYASGARRIWTENLRPLRPQLDRIELIGGNALVRMGGSVLGALIGVPVVNRS